MDLRFLVFRQWTNHKRTAPRRTHDATRPRQISLAPTNCPLAHERNTTPRHHWITTDWIVPTSPPWPLPAHWLHASGHEHVRISFVFLIFLPPSAGLLPNRSSHSPTIAHRSSSHRGPPQSTSRRRRRRYETPENCSHPGRPATTLRFGRRSYSLAGWSSSSL